MALEQNTLAAQALDIQQTYSRVKSVSLGLPVLGQEPGARHVGAQESGSGQGRNLADGLSLAKEHNRLS